MKPFIAVREDGNTFAVVSAKGSVAGVFASEVEAVREAERLNDIWADGFAAGQLGMIQELKR